MTTVVAMMDATRLGSTHTNVICANCQEQVYSDVKAVPGVITWLLFALSLLLGCWLGCCLIPFYVDSCKDVEHSCPKCHAPLGKFRRL